MAHELVNDAYLTLQPYVPGKPVSETERELGISGVIKLASNENAFGPSPKAVEAMRAALTGAHDYPDASAFHLKRAIAERLGVAENQLMMGNGGDELIDYIVRACIRPGESLLYANPSFISYKMRAQQAGVAIREVPLKDHRYDLPAMAKAVDATTKLVFIANPNNPTGTYITAAELDAFLTAVPRDLIVVLDEAYLEYVRASDFPKTIPIVKTRPRTLALRTFSKAYGLAGVRVGYAVGEAELTGFLERGRQPFNCNSLAQVAALAALADKEHIQRSVDNNTREMERVSAALRGMRSGGEALGVTPSQANFIMVDVHTSGPKTFEALLQQGIIVRPLANYGLMTHVRITLGTPEQNDRMLAAMRHVVG
jgi:histidinol-phosphate aminotransferase